QVAPLFWLGYITDCGLGGRARYWFVNSDTDQSVLNPTRVVTAHPVGQSLIAEQARALRVTSELDVQVLDLECLQAWQCKDWDLPPPARAPPARIRQSYNATLTTPDGFNLALLSGHKFEGAGPVVAGEVRRLLGNTGFSLYGNARAALVFGSADQ